MWPAYLPWRLSDTPDFSTLDFHDAQRPVSTRPSRTSCTRREGIGGRDHPRYVVGFAPASAHDANHSISFSSSRSTIAPGIQGISSTHDLARHLLLRNGISSLLRPQPVSRSRIRHARQAHQDRPPISAGGMPAGRTDHRTGARHQRLFRARLRHQVPGHRRRRRAAAGWIGGRRQSRRQCLRRQPRRRGPELVHAQAQRGHRRQCRTRQRQLRRQRQAAFPYSRTRRRQAGRPAPGGRHRHLRQWRHEHQLQGRHPAVRQRGGRRQPGTDFHCA